MNENLKSTLLDRCIMKRKEKIREQLLALFSFSQELCLFYFYVLRSIWKLCRALINQKPEVANYSHFARLFKSQLLQVRKHACSVFWSVGWVFTQSFCRSFMPVCYWFVCSLLSLCSNICMQSKWPIRSPLIPGFCSLKRLGVCLLPPGWDADLLQGYTQH